MTVWKANICPSGHVKIDFRYHPESPQICQVCGQPMMAKCPACGDWIWIKHYYGNTQFDAPDMAPPPACRICGASFPWS